MKSLSANQWLPRKAAVALLLLSVNTGVTPAWGQYAVASHAMVASADPLASQVGVEVMKRGGNAVDAAVAVGLALAVTLPAAGNLGGGGFMLIRMADSRTAAIDYREAAPALAQRDMYLDKEGKVIPNASLVGYRAVGVPGTIAGFALAQKKYGVLKWRDVVEPARRLAEQGFRLTFLMAAGLRLTKKLAQFTESRHVFLKDGQLYQEGDLFKQPELAATLRRLEENGPREFYAGQTAQLIATDMRAHGGLITLADLKSYKAAERLPLHGSYRGVEILSMPPPSSGGVALLEMLNILEQYDLAGMGYNSADTDHLLIETMRRAFADRAEFLGDPDFVRVPVQGLLSKTYAAQVARTIDPHKATPSAQIGHGQPPPSESPQTTHYSLVDSAGNAVANTYTLNAPFGSGVTVRGAGFLLNDEMDDFTSKPGAPNLFGLIQGEANAIASHKRPLSSMTPTILVKNGKLFLVIGSPGGPTIITTVLQVILDVIDHGMDLRQAISAPRLHHQWQPDFVSSEAFALPRDVEEALRAKGHRFPEKGGFLGVKIWGDAQGVMFNPTFKAWLGVSDPRGAGAALGY